MQPIFIRADDCLLNDDTGGANGGDAAHHDQGIVLTCGAAITDVQIGHGIDPFAIFKCGLLVNARQPQHVRSGPFEIAQVIGVIDKATMVGIFEIDAHRQMVRAR